MASNNAGGGANIQIGSTVSGQLTNPVGEGLDFAITAAQKSEELANEKARLEIMKSQHKQATVDKYLSLVNQAARTKNPALRKGLLETTGRLSPMFGVPQGQGFVNAMQNQDEESAKALAMVQANPDLLKDPTVVQHFNAAITSEDFADTWKAMSDVNKYVADKYKAELDAASKSVNAQNLLKVQQLKNEQAQSELAVKKPLIEAQAMESGARAANQISQVPLNEAKTTDVPRRTDELIRSNKEKAEDARNRAKMMFELGQLKKDTNTERNNLSKHRLFQSVVKRVVDNPNARLYVKQYGRLEGALSLIDSVNELPIQQFLEAQSGLRSAVAQSTGGGTGKERLEQYVKSIGMEGKRLMQWLTGELGNIDKNDPLVQHVRNVLISEMAFTDGQIKANAKRMKNGTAEFLRDYPEFESDLASAASGMSEMGKPVTPKGVEEFRKKHGIRSTEVPVPAPQTTTPSGPKALPEAEQQKLKLHFNGDVRVLREYLNSRNLDSSWVK